MNQQHYGGYTHDSSHSWNVECRAIYDRVDSTPRNTIHVIPSHSSLGPTLESLLTSFFHWIEMRFIQFALTTAEKNFLPQLCIDIKVIGDLIITVFLVHHTLAGAIKVVLYENGDIRQHLRDARKSIKRGCVLSQRIKQCAEYSAQNIPPGAINSFVAMITGLEVSVLYVDSDVVDQPELGPAYATHVFLASLSEVAGTGEGVNPIYEGSEWEVSEQKALEERRNALLKIDLHLTALMDLIQSLEASPRPDPPTLEGIAERLDRHASDCLVMVSPKQPKAPLPPPQRIRIPRADHTGRKTGHVHETSQQPGFQGLYSNSLPYACPHLASFYPDSPYTTRSYPATTYAASFYSATTDPTSPHPAGQYLAGPYSTGPSPVSSYPGMYGSPFQS